MEKTNRNLMTCKHPPAKRHDLGEPRPYNGSVARFPFTDEDRRAHGWIRQLVECGRCGAQRHENRNQSWTEVSPWWDARGDRERAEAAQADERSTRAANIRTLRAAYGDRGDIVEHDKLCLLLFPNVECVRTEVVIGLNMVDAAKRTRKADAETIRHAMRERAVCR